MGKLIMTNKARCPNHPERVVRSRGLCGSCYDKVLRAENPGYAKRQRENTQQWVKENTAKSKALKKEWDKKKGPTYGHIKKLRSFGITPSDFDHMMEVQGGCCHICLKPPPEGRRLHIDHNHDTGEIRGLLCFRCNFGLSFFKENPETLLRAVEHLRGSTLPKETS